MAHTPEKQSADSPEAKERDNSVVKTFRAIKDELHCGNFIAAMLALAQTIPEPLGIYKIYELIS